MSDRLAPRQPHTFIPMTDAEAAASIAQQADDLAKRILSAAVPDLHDYRALHGLVALADGAGVFEPTDDHLAALERPLPPTEAAEWVAYLARKAARPGGT